MIAILIVDKKEDECEGLRELSKYAVSRMSDEKLEFFRWAENEAASIAEKEKSLLDAIMVEISTNEEREVASAIRRKHQDSELMVISDAEVSPMQYLNPAIRAVSLLLRPYSADTAKSVVMDFYAALMSKREISKEACFVIENQDGKQIIPYSDIYYFEVNEKKIYARTKSQVYSKYGTLEQLEKSLPSQFMRCHRSYIVNTDRLVRARLTEGLLYLTDDVAVPLSRSYKMAMKEFFHAISK